MKATRILVLALLIAPFVGEAGAASLADETKTVHALVDPLTTPDPAGSNRQCSTTVCAIAIALASPVCSVWTNYDVFGRPILKTAQCTAVGTIGGGGAPTAYLPGHYSWGGWVASSGDVSGTLGASGNGVWGVLGGALTSEQTKTIGTTSLSRIPFFTACRAVTVDAYVQATAQTWIPPTAGVQGINLDQARTSWEDVAYQSACITW